VIFDDDTPEGLIRKLRPDVLIKGADYSVSQVVGAEFVVSYGGKIFLAELTPNHSTTHIVSRFQRFKPQKGDMEHIQPGERDIASEEERDTSKG